MDRTPLDPAMRATLLRELAPLVIEVQSLPSREVALSTLAERVRALLAAECVIVRFVPSNGRTPVDVIAPAGSTALSELAAIGSQLGTTRQPVADGTTQAVPIVDPRGDLLGAIVVQPVAGSTFSVEQQQTLDVLAQTLAPLFELYRSRQQITRQAEVSASILQLVFDTMPMGVFWKDRNSRYLGCNRAVAQAFGLASPSDIVGRTDYELPGLTREQADFFIAKDRQVMEANAAELAIVEPARMADGRTHWLETNKVPLHDEAGNVIGILGTWQNVTERKRGEEDRRRLEAQMQHAQKLESLGILAGGIAHDFNNLLTCILGYSDLALLELPAVSPARPLIEDAMNGARRAAELTQQMLAYSGKGRFVVQPLNLSALIEEMARLLQISVGKKSALKYDLHRTLPPIEADAAQMRQIVMNLVINASEAIAQQSGIISVSTGVMHCDRRYLLETYLDEQLPEGTYVFLEVADNGSGMDEETRARIFDPFFTTKFTGRGLGLSAVLGIVRGHRGAIKCYSEPGRGTTFKVLFPRVGGVAQPLETGLHADTGWKSDGLVLVVDDEESIREIARQMLRRMGFTVLTACDGNQALEVFRIQGDNIRLVLLDMTMPNLDGEETFREMRRLHAGVRAILSSGYNEQTATSRFAGKGLAGFLQKPYRFEELQNMVRKVLG